MHKMLEPTSTGTIIVKNGERTSILMALHSQRIGAIPSSAAYMVADSSECVPLPCHAYPDNMGADYGGHPDAGHAITSMSLCTVGIMDDFGNYVPTHTHFMGAYRAYAEPRAVH